MQIHHFLGTIGGLSLFLFGMKVMSEGLEELAGKRLEIILGKMTDTKIKAILAGTLITCLIQSSSAMTILLVGFVNAKVMKLKNAIWVVMGANIGTTITGVMIALNIGMIAPLLSLIGVCLLLFIQKEKCQNIGYMMIGLGVLFMGLDMMSISLKPLQYNTYFMNLMKTLSHPVLAILFGVMFTCIIQSSSASLGILQALSHQGFIPLSIGLSMIYGFNIGTCITAFLASLTSCDNAKRLTCFHILLNIYGTVVFFVCDMFLPFDSIMRILAPDSIMMQLACFHTLFNLISTIIVLPIDCYLIRFVYKMIPEKKDVLRKMDIEKGMASH